MSLDLVIFIVSAVVAVFGANDPALIEKTVSNMQELRARGGTVVAVTTEDSEALRSASDHTLKVPKTPFEYLNTLLSTIPLQLLAYHMARLKGCDIDQPRNLAKSVTVE